MGHVSRVTEITLLHKTDAICAFYSISGLLFFYLDSMVVLVSGLGKKERAEHWW
jgi:hypothetical protein